MQIEPTIRPLSTEENIYAICDDTGRTIGTGTREVCEVLLFILTSANAQPRPAALKQMATRSNIRAAIAI
jgi:hypothetical protein